LYADAQQELLAYSTPLSTILSDNSLAMVDHYDGTGWYMEELEGMSVANIDAVRNLEMHRNSITISITANTVDVLKKLKENRERHVAIAEEAKSGFFEKANKVLQGQLHLLREGKITSVRVNMSPPQTHLGEYDQAITALEFHQEAQIDLNGDQVSCFLNDDWNWQQSFVTANLAFSAMANDYGLSKGYDLANRNELRES
jgi:hypothetical protein